jgi:hypothetical protein
MDPAQQTAAQYYNTGRKRTFLFSRVIVITSMLVLLIALGINIFVLNAPNTSTVKTNAYYPSNPEKNLPSLPAGCSYQQAKSGMTVVCPTTAPAPAGSSSAQIDVALPVLPSQCNFRTSATGDSLHCSAPNIPIPTIPVTFPDNCIATPQANIAACKNTENKIVAVPLPSLPAGCSYELQAGADYVICQAQQ